MAARESIGRSWEQCSPHRDLSCKPEEHTCRKPGALSPLLTSAATLWEPSCNVHELILGIPFDVLAVSIHLILPGGKYKLL